MKKFIAPAMFVALALAPSTAMADVGDKVTGGGQTFFDSSDTKGAGSTIAFNAKEGAEGITGQVQYINRQAGTGRASVKFHGDVICLRVFPDGRTAEIGARAKSDRYPNQFVLLFVQDNGEGSNAESDLIDANYDTAAPDCEEYENDDSPAFTLARGNVQVHKAGEPQQDGARSFSFKSALRLARFGR